MPEIVLTSKITHDEYTAIANNCFDVPRSDSIVTTIKNNLSLEGDWNVGLITGPSGSGKSSILRGLGKLRTPTWNSQKSVISNFSKVASPEEAASLLCAVGFSSIPTWLNYYHNLSNGEKFRADLARLLVESGQPILVDEYASFVNVEVAQSASNSLQKWIRKNNKQIVLASCRDDFTPFLQPDWIYNTLEAKTHRFPRESLSRPPLNLEIIRCNYSAWEQFKHHHYLSSDINKAARCFLAIWNGRPVAFSSSLTMPSPYFKGGWRETRTVVLPDFQGLGIGVKFSDYIGALVKANGGRYFSKTIHPAMVSYRLRSSDWKETSHSRQARNAKSSQSKGMDNVKWETTSRPCWAFEYIGAPASSSDAKLFC